MAIKIRQRTIKFENDISVQSEIDAFILDETKKLSKSVLSKVVRRTPFRSGQAKRNWLVSEASDTKDFVKIEQNPIALSQAETLSLTEGFNTINGIKVYSLVYIVNNAPYIVRLNNGYSLQAPSLYVDSAILEAINDRVPQVYK